MASWKLQRDVTFNDVACSIITQATNFDIHSVIDEGIVILCNKTGFQCLKLSTDTSNLFTSSSTSETPHDLTEDDYHEVGWDDNDDEEKGEGEIDEEEGEMDEGGDEEETDIASFNLELSTATPSQNEFNSGGEFASVTLNPSLTSFFYLELSTPMDFNSNGDFASIALNSSESLTTSFNSSGPTPEFDNRISGFGGPGVNVWTPSGTSLLSVPISNTTIPSPRRILHISGDQDVSHTLLAHVVMNVTTANYINSDSKFVPVMPNPNTTISDPRCILHIPGDLGASDASLAQVVNIATTKCGVLTIFSYQELSAVTLSQSTLNSNGEFMPIMLNPHYDSGYTHISHSSDKCCHCQLWHAYCSLQPGALHCDTAK